MNVYIPIIDVDGNIYLSPKGVYKSFTDAALFIISESLNNNMIEHVLWNKETFHTELNGNISRINNFEGVLVFLKRIFKEYGRFGSFEIRKYILE